jgi:hypothetical protein
VTAAVARMDRGGGFVNTTRIQHADLIGGCLSLERCMLFGAESSGAAGACGESESLDGEKTWSYPLDGEGAGVWAKTFFAQLYS